MAKLILTDVSTGLGGQVTLNQNNTLIEAAFENTLSRNGASPNEMNANLDMNGFEILNADYDLSTTDFTGVDLTGATGTDLTYTAATNLLDIATGTGVNLPVFTSADDGLVPNSLGGITNFLRADGTWAAPPGGGADTLGPDGDKGDITVGGAGTTLTIDNSAVTLAKIQNVATDIFLGRDTAGSGVLEQLSVATAKTLLNLAGTNSGDVTLAVIGATPNANAATLTGQALNLEPASAAFGGVVTTGVQTFAGNKTLTGTLQTVALFPTVDSTSDIGTTSLRYGVLNANRLRVLVGPFTTVTATGDYTIAAVADVTAGSGVLDNTGGVSLGKVNCSTAGSTATLRCIAGTTVMGVARVLTTINGLATIEATNTGAFVSGFAINAAGAGSPTRLTASGQGAAVLGFVSAGIIQATFDGAVAIGAVSTGTISAAGLGNLALGYVVSGGTTSTGGNGSLAGGYNNGGAISSLAGGGIAWGVTFFTTITAAAGAIACGNAGGGSISASGQGSVAHGNAASFAITASNSGSVAMGNADTAAIVASAANSVQFAPGTNAVAISLQVGDAAGGTGVWLMGAGLPGSPVNGQIWKASSIVNIRSNGQTILLNRQSTYTQTYSTATTTHAARTAVTLTGNAGGTGNTAMVAVPDPADTPVTADALRDDLVANVLPVVRDDLDDLRVQLNALKVDADNTAQLLNQLIDNFQTINLVA